MAVLGIRRRDRAMAAIANTTQQPILLLWPCGQGPYKSDGILAARRGSAFLDMLACT